MRLYHFISLVAMITQASAASRSSSHSRLKGWFACSDDTFTASGNSTVQKAECAFYKAPLCYPGICEAPAHVHSTVKVFVKRIPAVRNPENAFNFWLLQEKSDVSASSIHAGLNGLVNVYTMDQRGSGHGTRLDCVTMPINATASPLGNSLEVSQVPACAHELEKKYGDLASFSITSAATDVATFISDFTNGLNTIVCGLYSGTVIVERLIHLSPPEVTGYVLDGVSAISGAPQDKSPLYTAWDFDFGEVGDTFLALCAKISECNERFESKSLPATLQDVITQFDENPKSTCAALVSDLNRDWSSEPASYILRRALSAILADTSLRTIIPPVVYRLNRCEPKDISVLKHFFKVSKAVQTEPGDDSAFESPLLEYLVNYSEMWEKPTPSIAEMTSRVTDASISPAQVYSDVPIYCAFSKEESAVCDKLDLGNYRGNGILYEVDKYWNKSAKIPPQASVLLLSGKLDPVTPHKYAESFMEALIGEKKELVTFEYAANGALLPHPINEDKDSCGMKLLLSYVTNDGDLTLLDKSCVEEMPAFNMTPADASLYFCLGTNDPYDGMHIKGILPSILASIKS